MVANSLPAPVITEHGGFVVVRDDFLPGGTKRRAISALFDDHKEYCYASPVYGYAQLALAYAARDHGKRATVFCAKRKIRHHLTDEAEKAGAQIIEIPSGRMSVLKYRVADYAAVHGAVVLPFGLDTPAFIEALAEVARGLPLSPSEVWTVVGSGALSRALQKAWPKATFFGVRVGRVPFAGKATVLIAPEKYEDEAEYPPPFPSCSNYDAKVWRMMKVHASPGALFWNVGR